jgi:6-methylsalicylate decarboxylase
MDKLDVRLAILSISSPGVHFGDPAAAAAVALARAVNETGAQIARARSRTCSPLRSPAP